MLFKANWKRTGLAVLITLGLMALAPAAQAAGTKTDRAYECAVNTKGYFGWVPRKVMFRFLENDTKVKVMDPFTYSVKEAAIVTKLKTKTNGKKTFRWMVGLRSSANYLVNVSYKVEFDPRRAKGQLSPMCLPLPVGETAAV